MDRGHDAFWWRRELGLLDLTVADAPPGDRPPPPLVTGIGGGHTVGLRSYANDGMRLLGHVRGIRDGRLLLADDLERNLAAGDRTCDDFTGAVDRHIAECGLGLPDEPLSDVRSAPPSHSEVLDLVAESITSVIWATGYVCGFAWVHLPIFDQRGLPLQRRGATAAAGVYFLGLAWMHKVKSSFLYGVGEDARQIAEFVNGRDQGAKGAA